MANPTLLEMPIARDGAKNSIPSTTSPTTGLLSQQYGWQDINSMPVQQGGKAPSRLDFNGVLNLLSNILFYAQKGWQFEWDSSQAYYAGCIVKDTNDGKMYMCIDGVTSTTAPHADTTNWKLWDLSMLANYLPLSGGHMTGITIDRNVDNSALLLCGGKSTSNIGSFLQLDGGNNTQVWNTDGGSFILATQGASNEQYVLRGGKNILEWGKYSPNPQAMYDLGGSSIVAKYIGGNGYIRYSSRFMMCWGTEAMPTTPPYEVSVTFPLTFNEAPKIVSTPFLQSSNMEMVALKDQTVSYAGFTLQATGYCYVQWLAVGYK